MYRKCAQKAVMFGSKRTYLLEIVPFTTENSQIWFLPQATLFSEISHFCKFGDTQPLSNEPSNYIYSVYDLCMSKCMYSEAGHLLYSSSTSSRVTRATFLGVDVSDDHITPLSSSVLWVQGGLCFSANKRKKILCLIKHVRKYCLPSNKKMQYILQGILGILHVLDLYIS